MVRVIRQWQRCKMGRIYYHGTTDKFQMHKMILPSSITGIRREEFRKKYADKVFFTSSYPSAYMYAKKAVENYGGNPVVYIVRPMGLCLNTVNNEFIADKALIIMRK